MTRKDYQLIADACAHEIGAYREPDFTSLVLTLADYIEDANANFDRGRFLEAAMYGPMREAQIRETQIELGER